MNEFSVFSTFGILIFFCALLHASPEDRKKPLTIHADALSFSESTGQIEYRGHVKLEQGSITLTADRIIISEINHELETANAFGTLKNPAHYSEKMGEDVAFFHAYANNIHYDHKKHVITLLQNAKLIRGKESLKAPVIQYDTEKRELITKNVSGQQTEIILEKGRLQ